MSLRNRQKLIVGIDYGTTFSGLSFALSNATAFRDIHPWTSYPGAPSHNAEHSVKAPTRVAFASENPDLDDDAWGYQVEPGMKSYCWTKLLLDKDTLQSKYDDPSLAMESLSLTHQNELMTLPEGKSAKDVVAQYLKGMYAMFEAAIIEKMGEDCVTGLPIDYWFTVPATWSERAKLLTKAAAQEAGFASKDIDRIMLIAEPEAAAQLALKSGLHDLESFVKVGTKVMVCDCGGGTVDITSYGVEETSPTLQLKEIAVGIAGKCGGTFVDRNLFGLMEERFGAAFTSLEKEQIGPGSSFMDQFESKKKDFSMKNPSKRPHRLVLPMPTLELTRENQMYYESRSSSVLLRPEDYQRLFDPVIDNIFQLLQNQIDQAAKTDGSLIDTLVLVGGFGSSPYLKERLGAWCKEKNIRLTTPISGGWSAIVCGAVVRGLEGSIVREKKCRRHYGYSVGRPFDHWLHRRFNKSKRYVFTDMVENKKFLTGFMKWKIKKGDTIQRSTEISSSMAVQCNETHPVKHFVNLYSCSLGKGPDTIEDDGIEQVGQILYSLDLLDLSTLKSIVDSRGVTWYRPEVEIKIRLDDESGLLAFSVWHSGKEVGTAHIEIASS
ncbi:unnamed protein product [Clonostachys rosea f. rosea IK726]|uniref:Actin-like ATPase domain-containing protein n=2 Tax=Bionectria ochroleuca TaxID=29856 RepID=A0A0B7K429_BIOOC|nr:unnamed protein product [Clonostachys rosea f. rosea IK726]